MGASGRVRTVVRVWVDALTYAVLVTGLVTVAGVALGIATGGGLVRGKHLLFVAGWLMMAYATAKLWIRTGKQLRGHHSREEPADQEGSEETPDSVSASTSLRRRVTEDPVQRNVYGESLRGKQDATRFQTLVQQVPPNRWTKPPRPESRMTIPGKILVASVLVLAVSFAMEVGFGIA